MASEKIIKQKEDEVAALAALMKDAELVLLTDYRGINVADVTLLRKTIRQAGGKYCVIKNNITRRALNANGISELDEKLVGPTAVIIAEKEYLPTLKAVHKYAKENDFYKIKAGVLEGKVIDVEELNTLAQLPSREELIAKLAGALLGNISKLAATLDAVKVKKESEEAK